LSVINECRIGGWQIFAVTKEELRAQKIANIDSIVFVSLPKISKAHAA